MVMVSFLGTLIKVGFSETQACLDKVVRNNRKQTAHFSAE